MPDHEELDLLAFVEEFQQRFPELEWEHAREPDDDDPVLLAYAVLTDAAIVAIETPGKLPAVFDYLDSRAGGEQEPISDAVGTAFVESLVNLASWRSLDLSPILDVRQPGGRATGCASTSSRDRRAPPDFPAATPGG